MSRLVSDDKKLLHCALRTDESWSATGTATRFSWLHLGDVSILGASQEFLPKEEAAGAQRDYIHVETMQRHGASHIPGFPRNRRLRSSRTLHVQQDRTVGHWTIDGDVSAVYGRVHPEEAAVLQHSAAAQRSRVQLADHRGQLLQAQ